MTQFRSAAAAAPSLTNSRIESEYRARTMGSAKLYAEASHLALRLARAYTGKPKVVRFVGHFHGWHDQVAAGSMSHFDGSVPAGIPQTLVEQTILLPADDVAVAADTLSARDDIAAVI